MNAHEHLSTSEGMCIRTNERSLLSRGESLTFPSGEVSSRCKQPKAIFKPAVSSDRRVFAEKGEDGRCGFGATIDWKVCRGPSLDIDGTSTTALRDFGSEPKHIIGIQTFTAISCQSPRITEKRQGVRGVVVFMPHVCERPKEQQTFIPVDKQEPF